jgi:hypothetical protein
LTLLGLGGTADFSTWQRARAQEPTTLDERVLDSLPAHQRTQALQKLRAVQSSGAGAEVCTYRRFHPEDDVTSTARIQIPTVHVLGARDEMFGEQSVAMVGLCDARMVEMVKHAKGHEVPREASQEIARAVQRAATRAEFMV